MNEKRQDSAARGQGPPLAASPLNAAALAVVGDDADAGDIRVRLAAAGARLDDDVAAALLVELAAMGLTRVARGTGTQRRYVLTTLGRQALRVSPTLETAAQLAELEQLRTDLLSTIAHGCGRP